ncbi:MAG: DUF3413 domain-containing protein [Succinivibrio dextrinosolvens]|uniref:DUF3413 domain-containing protein n=1 Tax=Succinivibrio sp. TaxID=2053619 RepID=UPI0025E1EE3A|nr:DUF3413 domain-containing protein [Succinivibrio sp.]MBQ9221655.1 DUF3413 domain-containing protein [Succinivibrio sp.]MDY6415264.1 DUF3413 domain-containing protein [Succinivibrio dextrinosolvens]MDY6466700.1 DUF3413 domain-containing protein [Succinivibrio dextrinosolvens]
MTKLQNKFLMKEQTIRSTTWGHHFIFLNCLLAILTGFTYVYCSPGTESFISFSYLLVTWLGQISFLSFLAFLIFFFPLTFIGNFKVYRIISIIAAVLLHCLLLVDAKLFLSLKVHLSWSVVSLMIRDLTFNTGLNFNFMYIAIPLVIFLELIFARLATREIYKSEVRNNYFPAIVMTLVTACFITSHGIYIWADAANYEKITNLRSVFPAHYPMTAKSFLTTHGWIENITAKTDGTSTSNIAYPLTEIKFEEKDIQKNVITIFINGLSYSDLDAETTPNLIKLKMDNLSFENHYLPYDDLYNNLFASWFGLPIQYEQIFTSHSVENISNDVMQKEEYLIRGFTSTINGSEDSKLSKMTGMKNNKLKNLSSDTVLLNEAADFIEKNTENRMAVTLSLNSLLNINSAESHKRHLKLLDTQLGKFISRLEEKKITERTMVIISSSLGNKFIGGASVYSKKKQRVPFIIINPDSENKGVSKNILTSSFDINPTIAVEILGVTTPCVNYGIGDNVLALEQRDYIPTTQGNNLLLISQDAVTIYKRNGKVVTTTEEEIRPARANLENLIRAMRDFNRFKK